MNNDQEQDRGEFAPCPIEAQTVKYWEANSVINMENFLGSGKPVDLNYQPDWKEEYQKAVELHCITLDELREGMALNRKLEKIIANQHAMLERQTARIVELQEHIDNFDGEDR